MFKISNGGDYLVEALNIIGVYFLDLSLKSATSSIGPKIL